MSRAVVVSVDSEAMRFFIDPEALVIVTIRVDQTPVSIDRVVEKVALVEAPVGPNH